MSIFYMDKKKYFNKRKIKCIGNCISNKGEGYLHPITLQIIEIDKGNSIHEILDLKIHCLPDKLLMLADCYHTIKEHQASVPVSKAL